MGQAVKIKVIEHLTHDVLRIVTEKPNGLQFHPGQACDVSVNKEGWKEELRAFTFTSLPTDDFVEFGIKIYPSHQGVTHELSKLKVGDELLLGDVFGDISYKGEGVFIAGGAGITPFVAIFKDLKNKGQLANNKLIFANKTKADIILEAYFKDLLGDNFINVLSDEKIDGYAYGYVTENSIANQLENNQFVYLCGPPPMMDAVEKQLKSLGIEDNQLVKEPF